MSPQKQKQSKEFPCMLALDIGGTTIKAAAAHQNGTLVEQTLKVYPARAKDSTEQIIGHFLSILLDQLKRLRMSLACEPLINGIGFTFPGPFDYTKGISYIRGLDKFESLYGISIGNELQAAIAANPDLKAACLPEIPIRFINDAHAFALGELHSGYAQTYSRFVCLTVGTGLGSAFCMDGGVVEEGSGVPQHGWLYDKPFRKGIVDQYISGRGILSMAAGMGFTESGLDVKKLAELGRSGNQRALDVFAEFGYLVGEMLHMYMADFRPEGIIIGGQIAGSSDLFMPSLRQHAFSENVHISVSEEAVKSTLIGVTRIFR
jgi:glucokinase